MISVEDFRKLALSFPGMEELPHFDRTSFRANKKIVATLDVKNALVCLMLNLTDQSVFCAFDEKVIYPVPNKWGKQGATHIELKSVRKDILKDALTQAYTKAITPKSQTKKV